MPKSIDNEVRKQLREEYITGSETYEQLATKHGLGKRTVDEWGRKDGWGQLRKDARYRALYKAQEKLKEKLAESTVVWDSEVLDMVASLKKQLQSLIENPDKDKDGKPIAMSPTQIQRMTDALAKMNDIQRKITERDIQKVQNINQDKMEELRELLLGNAEA